MLEMLSNVMLLLAIASFVPVGLLALQVCAAVASLRWRGVGLALTGHPAAAARARIAVLVPAHDEAEGIAATIESIRMQLEAHDRLLVVADNCSDETARVSLRAGAVVIERHDDARRGKGYALDFGIRHLALDPPDVVVVIDADCILHTAGLQILGEAAMRSRRPVQALDLMRAPPDAGVATRVAAFAWVLKNQVRPLGFRFLGLPCQLMGTGMGFPWSLIRDSPLASGDLVEDLRLGLDLAAAGAAPLFCPTALVTSNFPLTRRGAASQRGRWEGGHVAMIVREGPRAFWLAIVRRRPDLAAMVLDLCIPPLTMLVLWLLLQLAIDAAVWRVGGASTALRVTATNLALLSIALAAAWAFFARQVVSLGDLLSVPLYIVAKLPLYAQLLLGRKRGWTRTPRDGVSDEQSRP